MRRTWLAALVLLCAPLLVSAQAVRGYYRFPTIHGDTVVFTAEGDLWTVPAEGGVARRLTSHPGEESHAAISPDGKTVAFSAQYEGPTEVYTMPLAGGLPTRQTWEGEQAEVVGWTPGGKVLYATRHHSTLPDVQLVEVDPSTRATTVLPLSQASDGCYEKGTLFFTRLPFQGSHTKRYQGGTAQRLWRWDGKGEAKLLTGDFPGTSKTPMWWQGRIYFASDRDGTMNLWSMNPDGSDLRQLTRHTGWDLASPALSEGRIVYQLGADIHLYDIATGRDATVPVTLVSDLDQMREHWIAKPWDYLTSAHLSPDGDRVALTARGQVFVAPVKQGRLVEATRHQGVRYRQARFMPDGKSLAALSDESGEVEWWRLPANGVGAPEQITRGGSVLRFDGVPSPDGAWIAFTDKNLSLWLADAKSGATTKVATAPDEGIGDLAWSPDSRWLAYVIPAANTFGQIVLYDVAGHESVALTSDRTDSSSPAWSPDGKWIYFLSDRNLATVVPSPWGVGQPEPYIAHPTKLYAVALATGERFPFRPDDELEAKPAAEKRRGNGRGKDEAGEKKAAVTVSLDRAGLETRVYEVPAPAGNYTSLATNGKRLFWLARTPGGRRGGTLTVLDVTNEDPKPKTLAEGVHDYELSADGAKVLVRTESALAVVDAGAKGKADVEEGKVDLSGWKLSVIPREEWRQMFTEAWRLERDYFYDRGMNGVDWPAMRTKYAPLVDRVTDREELSDILAQMVSELSALHIFVRGGDVREGVDRIEPASLGAVLQRDEAAGGWKVAHVYRADPDYPDELSPLARPGVGVADGDVIRMINGVDTLSVPDPAELLRGQAGRQVLLRVASGTDVRDVVVEPITQRAADDLRYTEWELTRRERVEKESHGTIGYVHLRAMTGRNYAEWARAFYPVFDRAGLIVDVRHNRGGNIDSWILEKLMRRAWFYWQPRLGQPSWNMQYAFRGHVVVLVDERTASDGEAFAEGFRRLGLGKVIGRRTWGGEIWLSSSNVLVDKGIATAAETGVYGPQGDWLIEGWGVEPDIVVDNPPHATYEGGDAQLEAAVAYLEKQIAEHPTPVPPVPAYPSRAKRSPQK